MPILIVERGPDAGHRFGATSFPITIGRDPTNSVALKDGEVSRFHLRIKKRGRLIIAEDLDSKNGSFLNGDRLRNAPLENGDRILVGTTLLMFLNSASDLEIIGNLAEFGIALSDQSQHVDDSSHLRLSPSLEGTPSRLPSFPANTTTADPRVIKLIFDIVTNVSLVESLEDAGAVLLKSLHTLHPSILRGVYMSYSANDKILTPAATRQFRTRQSLIVSTPDVEDAIARKQGIIRPGNAKSNIPSRVILPILFRETPIGVLHLEVDDADPITPPKAEILHLVLARCAATLETLQLRKELDQWMVSMIETIVAIIEAKDTYTHGHSERVSRFSAAIADELHLNRDIKRMLIISALCHDIGKIGVPDTILKKASILSADEYDEMKLHPLLGAEIIQHMPNAQRFISGVKYHHEKWDGTGYPEGLVGEDIPFFGRIIAIADVYDAMVSGRAYSGYMEQGDAIEKLAAEKDLFDPQIFAAFKRAYDNGTLTLKTTTQANQAAASPEAEVAEENKES